MKNTLMNAPDRIMRSFGYCWSALRETYRKEESFRLELYAYCLLLAGMLACGWPAWKVLAMTACYALIPFAETVNSAIEDVCDLASPDFSPLVRNAKDKGALAVLFAIALNAAALAALILA